MRAIIARWEALSQSDNWLIRQAAWVARWNFLRAGALTAEEQGRFSSDYVDAIRSEKGRAVLLVLAQMNPSGLFPLGKWVRHLLGGNYGCRLAAGVAIHRWLVEVESSGQRVASGSEASGEWRVEVHYSLLTTRHSIHLMTQQIVRQIVPVTRQRYPHRQVPPLPDEAFPAFCEGHRRQPQ